MVPDLVFVGVITGARGLKGELRIKPFTAEPDALFEYGPLYSEDGSQTYKGKVTGHAKGQLLARLKGIGDRTQADSVKGVKLFVPRDALPKLDEDEFYYADLIGLNAELVDGTPFGTVHWVLDVGAGVSLEVNTAEGPVLVPFTKAAVPVVSLTEGRVVIDPPDGLLEPPSPEEGKS
jgi:16S rRNA processing protein RimM